MLPGKYLRMGPSHLLEASGEASRASEFIAKHLARLHKELITLVDLTEVNWGQRDGVDGRNTVPMNSLVPFWNHVNIVVLFKSKGPFLLKSHFW